MVRVLLAVIAFLLGADLLVNLRPARPAMAAGLPDSGAQQQQTIDQLSDLNKKMDRLQSFLESGKLAVEVKEKDKAK